MSIDLVEVSALEKHFESRIAAALVECHKLKYYPTDFQAMLTRASAARVAEKLVISGELQSGLKRVASLGRLELSVESIMLEPEFESLFEKKFRDAAKWRLEQVKQL